MFGRLWATTGAPFAHANRPPTGLVEWEETQVKDGVRCYRGKEPPGQSAGLPPVKGVTEVRAAPAALLGIMLERERIQRVDSKIRVVMSAEVLSPSAEVTLVCFKPIFPTAPREFCLLSAWQPLPNGGIGLGFMSVDHPGAAAMASSSAVRGIAHVSGWVFEPIGGGMCRVTTVSHANLGGTLPGSVVRMVQADQPLLARNLRNVAHSLNLPPCPDPAAAPPAPSASAAAPAASASAASMSPASASSLGGGGGSATSIGGSFPLPGGGGGAERAASLSVMSAGGRSSAPSPPLAAAAAAAAAAALLESEPERERLAAVGAAAVADGYALWRLADGWAPVADEFAASHGVAVSTRAGGSLGVWRGEGILPVPAVAAYALLRDPALRREYDPLAVAIRLLGRPCGSSTLVASRLEHRSCILTHARDILVVVRGEFVPQPAAAYVVAARSVVSDAIPPDPAVPRAVVQHAAWILEPLAAATPGAAAPQACRATYITQIELSSAPKPLARRVAALQPQFLITLARYLASAAAAPAADGVRRRVSSAAGSPVGAAGGGMLGVMAGSFSGMPSARTAPASRGSAPLR